MRIKKNVKINDFELFYKISTLIGSRALGVNDDKSDFDYVLDNSDFEKLTKTTPDDNNISYYCDNINLIPVSDYLLRSYIKAIDKMKEWADLSCGFKQSLKIKDIRVGIYIALCDMPYEKLNNLKGYSDVDADPITELVKVSCINDIL